jgi:hypoxanthine phosphoribosyltransferase
VGRGEAGVLIGAPHGTAGGHSLIGPSLSPIERGFFQPVEEHAFAHPAEQDLARIFSFYRIRWVYEPTTFHLEFREDGRPAEQITPDFYLPDHDLFIELTTMRQRLVTRKNRKIRRLREIFPSLQIKLLYRKDYDRLVGAYPAPDHISDPQLGETVFESGVVQERLGELALEIFESSEVLSSLTESEGRQRTAPLHLIGVGSGSKRILGDLAAQLDLHACCVTTDLLMLSRYGGGQNDERVRMGQALKTPVAGRDVVLVADIVSSGLSLVYVTEWLRSKGARSVRICALLDREDARIIDIPLDFVGFRAPDEVLVGYGLSSYPQFRELSYIASIHEAEELAARG